MKIDFTISQVRRIARTGRVEVLRKWLDGEDRFALNRKCLMLPSTLTNRERTAFLDYSLRGAQTAGLGNLPHHLRGDGDDIHVSGPKGYFAAYKVEEIEWESIETARVPLDGEFGDLYGGQPFDLYRVRLDKPWLPKDKLTRTLPWFGYALAEELPPTLTFEEARRMEHVLSRAICPTFKGKARVGEFQGAGRGTTLMVTQERTITTRAGQLVVAHGWKFGRLKRMEV